jgi:hypothetical protein
MIKLSSTASDMNCFIICSYGREIVLILFSVWNLFAVGPYGHQFPYFHVELMQFSLYVALGQMVFSL